jgi:hypothetical protein
MHAPYHRLPRIFGILDGLGGHRTGRLVVEHESASPDRRWRHSSESRITGWNRYPRAARRASAPVLQEAQPRLRLHTESRNLIEIFTKLACTGGQPRALGWTDHRRQADDVTDKDNNDARLP